MTLITLINTGYLSPRQAVALARKLYQVRKADQLTKKQQEAHATAQAHRAILASFKPSHIPSPIPPTRNPIPPAVPRADAGMGEVRESKSRELRFRVGAQEDQGDKEAEGGSKKERGRRKSWNRLKASVALHMAVCMHIYTY